MDYFLKISKINKDVTKLSSIIPSLLSKMCKGQIIY